MPHNNQNTPSTVIAFLCLGAAMALVGCYVAMSKPLVAAFPVMLLAWLRFGIAAVYMLPWLKPAKNDGALNSKTHRLLFLESLIGNFLFSICMLYGVSLAGAAAAAIVFSAIPAAVAILSKIFLRETISTKTTLGIVLVVSSIALLALAKQGGNHPELQGNYAWGLLLLIAAVICEASYVVMGKRLTEQVSPKRISAIVNLWGLALMTPCGLWLAIDFDFKQITLPAWSLLLFYALAASAWSVQLWMTGLKSIPASKAGIMTVMLPISATLVGVAFLGETLGWLQWSALGLALAGVWLATTDPQKN
jgi:drug/metabolite transporter (DMT)-like permease